LTGKLTEAQQGIDGLKGITTTPDDHTARLKHVMPALFEKQQAHIQTRCEFAELVVRRLDLARDRDRHALAGQVKVADVKDAGRLKSCTRSIRALTAVMLSSPRPVCKTAPYRWHNGTSTSFMVDFAAHSTR
jgi:hypothetical protein